MKICVVYTVPNLKKEEYLGTSRDLGIDHDDTSTWPKGLLSHTAGEAAEGWKIVDVWESAELFDEFLASKLMPSLKKTDTLPPKLEFFDVHSFDARN